MARRVRSVIDRGCEDGDTVTKIALTGRSSKRSPFRVERAAGYAVPTTTAICPATLSYYSPPPDWSSDRSVGEMLTRVGENANACKPLNPVATGVTTPVLRSSRPTLFAALTAV
jgi:hypothetical protein